MASELLEELAPLLAEEGIDLSGKGAPVDLAVLQQAMNRAVERRELARHTPAGQARHLACDVLRQAAGAIGGGDTKLAASVLDRAVPESPDGSAATIAGCIGVSAGLLDGWLSGQDPAAPGGLAGLARLPAGRWTGERAASDLLGLARKGRAFSSLSAVIARQGGMHVHYGSALALTGALQAWSRHAGISLHALAGTTIR